MMNFASVRRLITVRDRQTDGQTTSRSKHRAYAVFAVFKHHEGKMKGRAPALKSLRASTDVIS